jgi:hypothetical protein
MTPPRSVSILLDQACQRGLETIVEFGTTA